MSSAKAGRTQATRGKHRRTGTVRARASARRRASARTSAASRAERGRGRRARARALVRNASASGRSVAIDAPSSRSASSSDWPSAHAWLTSRKRPSVRARSVARGVLDREVRRAARGDRDADEVDHDRQLAPDRRVDGAGGGAGRGERASTRRDRSRPRAGRRPARQPAGDASSRRASTPVDARAAALARPRASRRASRTNGSAATAPHASPSESITRGLRRARSRASTPRRATSSTRPSERARAPGAGAEERVHRPRIDHGRARRCSRSARRRSPTPSTGPAPRAHAPRRRPRGGRATTTRARRARRRRARRRVVLNASAPAVASTPGAGRSRAHVPQCVGERGAEPDARLEPRDVGRERAVAAAIVAERGGDRAARAELGADLLERVGHGGRDHARARRCPASAQTRPVRRRARRRRRSRRPPARGRSRRSRRCPTAKSHTSTACSGVRAQRRVVRARGASGARDPARQPSRRAARRRSEAIGHVCRRATRDEHHARPPAPVSATTRVRNATTPPRGRSPRAAAPRVGASTRHEIVAATAREQRARAERARPSARGPTSATSTICRGAVRAARDLHDRVDRGRELGAHRGERERDPTEQHERLEPGERVGRRVRVHGRERAVVTGVERLQHVEGLAAAHLADDQPVGPHPQRGAHQLAHAHRARALGVRGPRLEAHDVRMPEPQLGGLLDRDDPLGRRDRPGRARSRTWSCPRSSRRPPRCSSPRGPSSRATRPVAAPSPKSASATRAHREPADREARTVGSERREHRVQARAVGESRASTIGAARSSRSPSGAITRWVMRTIASASRSQATASRRPFRSTNTRFGPFTMISLIVGSASSGCNGPRPSTSATSSSSTRSAPRSVTSGASSRRSAPSRDRSSSRPSVAGIERRGEQPLVQRLPKRPDAATEPALTRLPPGRGRRSGAAPRATGRGERVGEAGGQHAGVDGSGRGGADADARQNRDTEHVRDVADPERPTGLVDEHRAASRVR